ncbi:MAG: EamA family transporter [Acidimicrobiia bacterium]|nr:EamA family transporter [Acidimicrobiia bacterium]
MLFLIMGLLWGVPYMMISIAVSELSPATLVWARTGIGALVLLPVAGARRQLRPVLEHWRALLAFTAIEICGPWFLIGFAQQSLTSSLTGLLIAAVPLVAVVIAVLTREETFDGRRMIGLLVGFAGVAALVGFDIGADNLWAVAAIGGVTIGYAVGPIILARHLNDVSSVAVMALSLAIAALVYTPFGVAQWPSTSVTTPVWLSIIGLGLVCTATAFVVYHKLVAEVGASRSTVITYINPAVALVLGSLVLDEPLTPITGFGFLLIIIGSMFAAGRTRTTPIGHRSKQAERMWAIKEFPQSVGQMDALLGSGTQPAEGSQ